MQESLIDAHKLILKMQKGTSFFKKLWSVITASEAGGWAGGRVGGFLLMHTVPLNYLAPYFSVTPCVSEPAYPPPPTPRHSPHAPANKATDLQRINNELSNSLSTLSTSLSHLANRKMDRVQVWARVGLWAHFGVTGYRGGQSMTNTDRWCRFPPPCIPPTLNLGMPC